MTLQTIIFPKESWTKQSAIHWLMEHGHKFSDIDTTSNFFRFRQQTPRRGSYYTITLPNHIELIYQE